jgi:hypothetical protein
MPADKQSIVEPKPRQPVRRLPFLIGRLLLVILFLFILIFSAAVIFHRALLKAYAPIILDSIVTQYHDFYDVDLTYANYKIAGISDIAITGVSVTDIPTGLTFLNCDSVHIQSSLLSLAIKGGDPMQGITSVVLDRPVVTLGRKEGRWNTGKLFEPSKLPKKKYPGQLRIEIRDGEVQWQGGPVAEGFSLPMMNLAGLQGYYRLAGDSSLGLELNGTMVGSEIEPGKLSISGTYDPATLLVKLAIKINGLDLKLAGSYLERYGFRNLTGLADTDCSMLIGPTAGASGFSMLGKAAISDAALHLDIYDLDATSVAGDLRFTHKSLFSTGLKGIIDGGDVTVKGRMGDFGNMTYDLAIDGSKVSQPTLRKIVPSLKNAWMEGPFNAHVELTGPSHNLSVLVQADSDSMKAAGLPLKLNNLLGWYSEKKFTLKRMEAASADGLIEIEGAMDLSSPKAPYTFHAVASKIQIDKLSSVLPAGLFGGYNPSGALSADVSLDRKTGAPSTLSGVIESPGISFPPSLNIPSLALNIPFKSAKKGYDISGASISGEGVSIIADGNFTPGGTSKAKIALAVDDPKLIGRVTGVAVQGKLAVAGNLVWAQKTGPEFDGAASFRDMIIGDTSVEKLSARVAISDGALHLSEFSGLVEGAKLTGDIKIPLSSKASGADGSFDVRGLDIGKLMSGDTANLVSTSLDLKGKLSYRKNESGQGEILVDILTTESAARVGDNLVSTGPGGLTFTVAIPSDFSGINQVTAKGAINSRPSNAPVYGGRVLTPYAARFINKVTAVLTGLPEKPTPAPAVQLPMVTGSFLLDADLHDPLRQPDGDINLTGTNVTIEGYDLTSLSLHLGSGQDNKWAVELSGTSSDTGSFEVKGEVDRQKSFKESTLALTAVLKDSGIDKLFKVLGLQRFGPFSGMLNGSGNITGTFESPVLNEFRIDVSKSEAFGISLNQGGMTFGYAAPLLNLTNLELDGDNGFKALGAGSIDLSAPTLTNATLVLRIDQFDLSRLGDVPGAKFPLGGVLSGTVQLARDALGPQILYTATVDNATINAAGETFTLGNINLDAATRPGSPQIDLNNLEITLNDQKMLIAGKLPLNFTKISSDLTRYIDLSITSDTGYSPPIPAGILAMGLSWEGGLGPVHLNLKGLELAGDFDVDVKNVKLSDITLVNALKGTFHASKSIISASPDEVKLIGDGWELGVAGKADILGVFMGIPNPMKLTVVPSVPGPIVLSGRGYDLHIELGSGEDAPAVAVTGKWPNITAAMTGKLSVRAGSMDLAKLPPIPKSADTETGKSLISLNFNIDLKGNLTITRSDTFNFAFESGSLAVTGPARMPSLSGTLLAPTGWLDILGNHFSLIEPLEMSFTSLYRFDPHVTAAAQATLQQVRSPANFGEELLVTARIDSRLSNLMENLKLSSVPPMNPDELLAALAYEDIVVRTLGGSIFGDSFGAPGIQDVNFEAVALPIASSYLSKYIRRKAGFSAFEVSIDQDQNVFVYVEKTVFKNLVMYYQQTFGPDTDSYLFGARYRWRPRSWVGLEFDNNQDIKGQVQYIIPLD